MPTLAPNPADARDRRHRTMRNDGRANHYDSLRMLALCLVRRMVQAIRRNSSSLQVLSRFRSKLTPSGGSACPARPGLPARPVPTGRSPCS